MIADLWQDLRYGARVLVKQPGFTLIAVLTLALGIGANTAIFSVVYHVLLKPLPYQDSEQLVWVWGEQAARKQTPHTPADFLDYQRRNQSFAQMAADRNMSFALGGAGQSAQPERVDGRIVSANYFVLLGVAPRLGRSFAPEDGQAGAARLVLLSHRYWQQRFGGEASVVGQSLTLSGEPATIVGVMPPDFREPGVNLWTNPRLIVPDFATNLRDDLTSMRRNPYLSVMARLKPGVTLPQAQADMDAISAGLRQEYPDLYGGKGVRLVALHEFVVGNTKLTLLLLFGAVGLVLLIVCANVANLTMARAATRTKEFALRAALGAGRGRLIRQLLNESVLLAVAGAALGIFLSVWGLDLLKKIGARTIPRLAEVNVDLVVLIVTAVVAVGTGILFGLIPAFASAKPELTEALKEGGRSSTTGARRNQVRNSLVVAEIALALVLLVGAGLLLKSYARVQNIDPGFDRKNILTAELDLPSSKYPGSASPDYNKGAAITNFWNEALRRVQQLPGVEAVAFANVLPLSGSNTDSSFSIEGREMRPNEPGPDEELRNISPDYFRVLKTPLLRGRFLTEADNADAPPVVIINEALAKKYWPNEDALGKRITFSDPRKPNPKWVTVVGIIRSIRHRALDVDPAPEYYLSLAQDPDRDMVLTVRSSQDPRSLASAVRREIQSIDPDQPLANIRTLEDVTAESVAPRRMSMVLLGAFAGIALLLASVGIYGVISYLVVQRTHEIGVRMALGAQRGDVLRLVVGHAAKLVGIGTIIGLVLAVFSTRTLSSFLYTVGAFDLATFLVVTIALGAVALLASYIPALRATRADPMIALSHNG